MTQNRSYHPQPRAVYNIYKPKLTRSQVIYIIHNYELFMASKALSLAPKVFHVNHHPKLFIVFRALNS